MQRPLQQQPLTSHDLNPLQQALLPFNKPAAAINGTDIRNENLAAASRLNPSIKAAVIVIPEREVPGTKANA